MLLQRGYRFVFRHASLSFSTYKNNNKKNKNRFLEMDGGRGSSPNRSVAAGKSPCTSLKVSSSTQQYRSPNFSSPFQRQERASGRHGRNKMGGASKSPNAAGCRQNESSLDSSTPEVQSSVDIVTVSPSRFKFTPTSAIDSTDRKNTSPLTATPSPMQDSSIQVLGSTSSSCMVPQAEVARFDICKNVHAETTGTVKLKRSLLEVNREKRRDAEHLKQTPNFQHLEPGMVLLKNHLSFDDQIRIIKRCRELGLGAGGFYRPGYSDGAKLNLQMMCLGKNWDPESRVYEHRRSFDGEVVPKIPEELKEMVERAICLSHDFLNKEYGTNAYSQLPKMSPDICIVNFYSKTGRLGMHQDRDESKESLCKGLPVVSFSLGDSAEFLYGNERDVEKAKKVVLESGDVLIFGGKSRHIFHSVSAIIPDTAPKRLIEETKLRPGRLNLTFRKE